jgi:hypothetical protein
MAAKKKAPPASVLSRDELRTQAAQRLRELGRLHGVRLAPVPDEPSPTCRAARQKGDATHSPDGTLTRELSWTFGYEQTKYTANVAMLGVGAMGETVPAKALSRALRDAVADRTGAKAVVTQVLNLPIISEHVPPPLREDLQFLQEVARFIWRKQRQDEQPSELAVTRFIKHAGLGSWMRTSTRQIWHCHDESGLALTQDCGAGEDPGRFGFPDTYGGRLYSQAAIDLVADFVAEFLPWANHTRREADVWHDVPVAGATRFHMMECQAPKCEAVYLHLVKHRANERHTCCDKCERRKRNAQKDLRFRPEDWSPRFADSPFWVE